MYVALCFGVCMFVLMYGQWPGWAAAADREAQKFENHGHSHQVNSCSEMPYGKM